MKPSAFDWRKLLPLVLVLAGVAVFANSLSGPFIFDDRVTIVENPAIRQFWPRADAPTPPSAVTGRPVARLSLALNYAAGGLNPLGYHLVNVALHITAALILFGLVRGTLGDPWPALVVALIWVVHPLQTECVNYIGQRTELLMGIFFLLTLYALMRSATSQRPRAWAALAVLACAAGMASKEVMAAAPLVALLYDRAFLSPSWQEVWRRRGGLHAGLCATWLVLAALIPSGQVATGAVGFQFARLTSWEYLLTQASVIVQYLQLSVWPDPLVLDYADWPVARTVAESVPSSVLVLALLAATVWACWSRPRLGFLGASFFLILAPTSSVLPIVTEIAAERRMYLPLVSVVIFAVLGAARLLANVPPRGLRAVLAGATVLALGVATVWRNQDYRSEVAIWSDTVAKRPGNPRAHHNLGVVLRLQGEDEAALTQFAEAVRIDPKFADAQNNLGLALYKQGQLREATDHFAVALRLRPHFPEAHTNLGMALARAGQVDQAREHYEAALRDQPDFATALTNMGNLLARQGKLAEAIEYQQRAVHLQPADALAHYNLGLAFYNLNRLPEAIAQFSEAVRLRPNFFEARSNLAIAFADRGDLTQAIAQMEAVVRLQPGNSAARIQLDDWRKQQSSH